MVKVMSPKARVRAPKGSKVIFLCNGEYTFVDSQDYKRATEYTWWVTFNNGLPYVAGWVEGKLVYLHRFITNAPKDLKVLHKDGNRRNNTKSNLLETNTSGIQRARRKQTTKSSSKYKGVSYEKRDGRSARWRAQLSIDKKTVHLGSFRTEREAAKAYQTKVDSLLKM